MLNYIKREPMDMYNMLDDLKHCEYELRSKFQKNGSDIPETAEIKITEAHKAIKGLVNWYTNRPVAFIAMNVAIWPMVAGSMGGLWLLVFLITRNCIYLSLASPFDKLLLVVTTLVLPPLVTPIIILAFPDWRYKPFRRYLLAKKAIQDSLDFLNRNGAKYLS